MTTINWNNIRVHDGSQDRGFEELCCQIFMSEPPAGAVRFERRGTRDAGLECAWEVGNGALLGLQAKYLTGAPELGEWQQVQKSVKTALDKNPKLASLTICIPQNFDDPKRTDQRSAMDQWKSYVDAWRKMAGDLGRKIEFVLWDKTQLVKRLSTPEGRGRRQYWFNEEVLSPDWFRRRIGEIEKDAGPRYSSKLNVPLDIAEHFEALARTREFLRKHVPSIRRVGDIAEELRVLDVPPEFKDRTAELAVLGSDLAAKMEALGSADLRSFAWNDSKQAAAQALDKSSDLRPLLAEPIRKLKAEQEAASTAKGGVAGEPAPIERLAWARRDLSVFAGDVATFLEGDDARLANNTPLLVTGAPGKGKTHLFVDVAKSRAERELPTILVLGENFQERDPLVQIVEGQRLTVDGDTFLQSLESAAQARGSRALIMIDALNDGAGDRLWKKKLAGFLEMLGHFPWIGVALSIRTSYVPLVIPEEVLSNVVRIEHEGFASKPEEAARAFFEYYEIGLPRIPMLNPEYTDPLLLKLLCKGLKDQGLHEVPEGQEGISRVFGAAIDAINQKLRSERKLHGAPHRNQVREFHAALADRITELGESMVPLEDALRLGKAIHPADDYQGSIIDVLVMEGLITSEPVLRNGTPELRVGFAYQRLGDHEVAARLLEKHLVGQDPTSAFKVDGPIGKLFATERDLLAKRGLIEALSIQLPERAGLELIDLVSEETKALEVRVRVGVFADAMVESFLWRKKESIQGQTLNRLFKERMTRARHDRFLDVVLMLAAVPGHPLNSDLLYRWLAQRPLPERDLEWTLWLRYQGQPDSAVNRLVEWALTPDDKGRLGDDAVLLAAQALAWFLTSNVRVLRDRTTKALVRLMTPRPRLLEKLLDRFAKTDDAYISERLFATVYGVALRQRDKEEVKLLAQIVFERLFKNRPPSESLLTLDYGRCVVEDALARGCVLEFDPALSRPPYGSVLPPDPPTAEELEKLIPLKNDLTDAERAFAHVVHRFHEPDISDFYGGPSFGEVKLTAIPLKDHAPRCRRCEIDSWERDLGVELGKAWQSVGEAKLATIRVSFDLRLESQSAAKEEVQGPAIERPDEELEEKVAAYEKAREDFEMLLSVDQLKTFREVVLAAEWPEVPRHDPSRIVAWTVQRALQLGWTKERFGDFDAECEETMIETRTRNTRIETLGSKYLWIAYHEIAARLCDNFYVLKGFHDDEAVKFDGTWTQRLRRLDPSFVPAPTTGTGQDDDPVAWWNPAGDNLKDPKDDFETWLKNPDDLPSLNELIVLKDEKSVEWVALESYLNLKGPRDTALVHGPERTLWFHVRGFFVRKRDSDSVLNWLKTQDFSNHWMPQSHTFDDVFLGEFYASKPWAYFARGNGGYRDWITPDRGAPGPVCHVSEGYRSDHYDASTPESVDLEIPCPLLVREGKLRWTGNLGQWESEGWGVVVDDPSVEARGGRRLVIRRDFLDAFLRAQEYDLLWSVHGEKLSLGLGERGRLTTLGAARYKDGEIQVELRHEFEEN